ncbi:MAG: sensor histidine kinase [Chloroflexota bacterium]|nr:MAG: sensor histidine kinase [Chloroflexota bacterium]
MKLKWFVSLMPLLAGFMVDILLSYGINNLPVIVAKADIGVLALLLGLVLSVVAGVWISVVDRLDQQRRQVISQAADERRRFLRRLDHELKNPLTAIRAGLANISEAPSQDSRQEALSSVEAQALRLSRLSADLRKLAELETRAVERSPVDIGALLQEAFTLAQDQEDAADRHLTLTIPQAPWPLPKIPGDPDLLLLAMHNLLDNALKFTRPGDTVEVRAFEDGSTVAIEVADTGPGIPPEDLPHVWEELFRGQGARGVPGSGLGLALVRAIAERHSGQVNLRSRAGQGTVFTLKLPAV